MNRTWLLIFAVIFVWSGIQPADFFTWVLEVSPAVIGLVVLLATRRTFPLTGLVYWLILLHCIVLMVGGHYTYAEVPLFDWIRDSLTSGCSATTMTRSVISCRASCRRWLRGSC